MVRAAWMLVWVAACGGAPRPVATEPAPRDESALVTRPAQLPEPVAEAPSASQPATDEQIHLLVTEVPDPAAAGEKLPMVFDDPKPAVHDDRCVDNVDLDKAAMDLASQGLFAAALAKYQLSYLCDPRAKRYDLAKRYFPKIPAHQQQYIAQACMPPSFASAP